MLYNRRFVNVKLVFGRKPQMNSNADRLAAAEAAKAAGK
jgi:hypothetical protein